MENLISAVEGVFGELRLGPGEGFVEGDTEHQCFAVFQIVFHGILR